MPQPAVVDTTANQLINLFRTAQTDIERQLAQITEGRRATRLRELNRTVTTILHQLEAATHQWVRHSLPTIYAFGAGDAAAQIGDSFVWTQPHIGALQHLATRSFDDILGATRFVARDTRAWIADEARQQLTLSLLEGRTVRQAAQALADAAGKDLGLFTVQYKDGSRHSLDDYADSAVRAISAETYNVGTINQSRDAGVEVAEVADGAECGLASHDDPEKPNGRLYPLEFIAQFPLSHPRCRRSILPRIDVKLADIGEASSLRPDAQRADQAASENVARNGRTPRTPRRSQDARVNNTIRRRGLRNTTAAPIVDRVGKAIDKVHEIPGGLRRIPVSIDPQLPKTTAAVFAHSTSAPIGIRINPTSNIPDLSYSHEYGHYLDFEGLAGPGVFASETLTGDGELMHDWFDAVSNSQSITAIRTASISEVDREYLLRNREMFARSYAQWIATRSADSTLVAQLETFTSRGNAMQWAADDFEPIGRALDDLFSSLGLIR